MGEEGAVLVEPFHGKTDGDTLVNCLQLVKRALDRVGLNVEVDPDTDSMIFLESACYELIRIWKRTEKTSEMAMKGILAILELCLAQCSAMSSLFEMLVDNLGTRSVLFWKAVVPIIYDSDLAYKTVYRDSLLFGLALYDANNSKGKMRELYAAVPGVRQSMLGIHAKRFGEKYQQLQVSRSRNNSRINSAYGSCEDLCVFDGPGSDKHDASFNSENLEDAMVQAFVEAPSTKTRVINVSNAPPVSVTRKLSGCWEIKQGSGGLVACVDPVMSVDKDNIWLANLGINPQLEDSSDEDLPPSTNTLGLPIIKQRRAGEIFHVLEKQDAIKPETEQQAEVERDMSLLSVLHDYNRSNYQLTPVIVNQDEYNAYYGGISNGLLWPALHNLPQHIVSDYDDKKVLNDHWCSYVRVNYTFAINAARNSRPQDFIWIHDYHLMLVGQIMQSLDSNLDVGFFLHIPFQPPDNFVAKYRIVAMPIIRGILRFKKVGFQTDRDRRMYIKLVERFIPRARVKYEETVDIFTISYGQNAVCSLGVFPVSIKNEDFLSIANSDQTKILAQDIRKEILSNSADDGRFFFSVERFDYTKGIMEKLTAWRTFFERHPERIGKDVLFQVAVTNRRSVDSYRKYQDSCLSLAAEINEEIRCPEYPNWRPIIFNTDGLPRSRLVAHYLAMDIGVVTPSKDGMNLVAKEMLICNPEAGLILSSGAGTDVQLGSAGFYTKEQRCYHRISDISDVEEFVGAFYAAATEDEAHKKENGSRLSQFLKAHDIDEWSTAFLDPSWTHEVIRLAPVKQISDFYILMDKTAQVRRQIVESVLQGLPIRQHAQLSLENAKNSLESSCKLGTAQLKLKTDDMDYGEDCEAEDLTIKFDISDEIDELHRDLAFLEFVQSDDTHNVENFVETLSGFHPDGPVIYQDEVARACTLLNEGDHFQHFFTDRDGTLKSYSCSYPTSVQPVYSAVIQAQFARKCAQFCAILTTSPLVHIGILNMITLPEGYYAYGASAGREWYMNPAEQFKDDNLDEDDLNLLNQAFEKVEDLLAQPKFRNFTWIGSGLQKHYGHLTISRQNQERNMNKAVSSLLFTEVSRIVHELDPMGRNLILKDGEFEMKIYARTYDSEMNINGKIFNKGHGIRLLAKRLKLKLGIGNILVCGDSENDLPMLQECLEHAREKVYTIWVTRNETLKKKVTELCLEYGNSHVEFVSCPAVLLGAMAQATVRVFKLRPVSSQEQSQFDL